GGGSGGAGGGSGGAGGGLGGAGGGGTGGSDVDAGTDDGAVDMASDDGPGGDSSVDASGGGSVGVSGDGGADASGGVDIPPGAHGLLVVGAMPLTAADMLLLTHLQAKIGVDVVEEKMLSATSADGKALVVIPASASASGTSDMVTMINRFRD